MKSIAVIALMLCVCALATLTSADCDSLKNNCVKDGAKFGSSLLKPVSACKALRKCKRKCREEKRDCRRECRKVKRGKKRRQCRKNCRKTKRVCRDECRNSYKTAACKSARAKILGSSLKSVGSCAALALCLDSSL